MKTNNVSNIAFGSAFTNLGKKLISNQKFTKFAEKTDYNGFTMSIPVTLTLLYGVTLIPRFLNAYDKHDRREILTRDLTSMTAIIFFAKSLEKGFSKFFTKKSGFVLNLTPKNHKGILQKLGNYFNPTGGIEVLKNKQIIAKYSDLASYKEGLTGFAKFIKGEGGDLKKVLSFDKSVKSQTEKILGKNLDKVSADEIIDSFAKAKKEDLQPIYDVFANPKNNYVRKAKIMNSAFNFVATFLMVPSFMIWLQKFNEKNTKRIVNAELEMEKQQKQSQMNINSKFVDQISKNDSFTS